MAPLFRRRTRIRTTRGGVPFLTDLGAAHRRRAHLSGVHTINAADIIGPRVSYSARRGTLSPLGSPVAGPSHQLDEDLAGGNPLSPVVPSKRYARVKKELEWDRWLEMMPHLVLPYCKLMLSTDDMRNPPLGLLPPPHCLCTSLHTSRITLLYMDRKSRHLNILTSSDAAFTTRHCPARNCQLHMSCK